MHEKTPRAMLPVYDEAVKLLAVAAALLFVVQAPGYLTSDPPHKCADCGDWNRPHEPFKVFGNTYFVGVDGISSVLVVGTGSILLDGGLPQSVAVIDANIRALGFKTRMCASS